MINKTTIVIVDCGMGNTRSVRNTIEYKGASLSESHREVNLLGADALIGVASSG